MDGSIRHPQGRPIEPETANWSATSEARQNGISRRAMARRASVWGRRLSSARLGFCRCADCACPRKARPWRDGLSGRNRASRHPQFRRCTGRGEPGQRPAPDINNEEERFSGNKHTTEYPVASIDAMVATLRGIGRDIGDIDAWLTSWDYPDLAGTLVRSVLKSCRKARGCCAPPKPPDLTAAGSIK
jgi:hypothetical protein